MSLRPLFLPAAGALALFALVACGGRREAGAPAVPVNDVYVSGWANDPDQGPKNMAAIWKNGELTTLTDGTQDAATAVVTVLGSTTYAVGTVDGVATLWQDSQIISSGYGWTADTGVLSVTAVPSAVAGQAEVYVCGFQADPQTKLHQAMLWKNGVAQTLTGADGTTASEAWDVKIAGGTPYLTGFIANGTNKVAQIWAGARQIPLAGPNPVATQGNAVFVDGAKVYAIGNKTIDKNDQAVTWVATLNPDLTSTVAATELTTPGHMAGGSDLKVAQGVAYAAGWEADGARHLAKLWVDGAPSTLQDQGYTFYSEGNSTEAYGASVVGTDVYVSGFISAGDRQQAAYWQNGALNLLGGAPKSGGSNVFAKAH
jgi:hypothetical protein